MHRSFICAGLLAFAASACTLVPSAVPGGAGQPARADGLFSANSAASASFDATQLTGCEQMVNDTLAKLDACVSQASLWRRLSHFQLIADENKGPDGHGYRDTGTPGYKASVDFVAKLMRQAGYHVTVQAYPFFANVKSGTPLFGTANQRYALERDWFVARRSGSGSVNAPVEPPSRSRDGCFANDFVGFRAGNIALMERGDCEIDAQVANAQRAGARAAILYTTRSGPYEARLNESATIPVIAVASGSIGGDLLRQYMMGRAPRAYIDIQMRRMSVTDYNVIADSPFGDAQHTVVIDGHLDSIYGAGMLDNASGSTSILATALAMAKTPTRNRLRYIWFGGEELGLVGSSYYTTHLTQAQLQRLVFDIDVDVSATPNFDIQIADPALASNSFRFPSNVIPGSKVGNEAFVDYFKSLGVYADSAPFGNDGTDSNSFALVGVPDSGILTRQDCCKGASEVALWGGFEGNYEGNIPSFDGGCVDMPDLWCDNLSNNDPFVLGLATKAVANVTVTLANDATLGR